MRITVVGTGYVGLVTGICLADNGNDVIGHDADIRKVQALQAGALPIYEPGLPEMLRSNLQAGRIAFTSSARQAIEHGQVIFLAVGTPARDDGAADVSSVLQSARQVAEALRQPAILVVKSTVPVGTCDQLQDLMDRSSRHRVSVVSNPEFLKEGSAVDDFLRPDRVIIGADDPAAAETVRCLYLPFLRNQKPILVMSRRAAELSKYAANAFLAMRISFINEIAGICERAGVDINQVRAGIGSDSRIGRHFLYPGPGYGGSCFPKDVQALAWLAWQRGARAELIEAVHRVNQRQQGVLFEKVAGHFGGDLAGRTFAVWGVTFKAKTDDIRESPALRTIDELLAAGAQVVAHDPQGLPNLRQRYGDSVRYAADAYAALPDADALLIVTEWNSFRCPDFGQMRTLMKSAVIFDGRNLYEPAQMLAEGFEYHSIGRPAVVPAARPHRADSPVG